MSRFYSSIQWSCKLSVVLSHSKAWIELKIVPNSIGRTVIVLVARTNYFKCGHHKYGRESNWIWIIATAQSMEVHGVSRFPSHCFCEHFKRTQNSIVSKNWKVYADSCAFCWKNDYIPYDNNKVKSAFENKGYKYPSTVFLDNYDTKMLTDLGMSLKMHWFQQNDLSCWNPFQIYINICLWKKYLYSSLYVGIWITWNLQ